MHVSAYRSFDGEFGEKFKVMTSLRRACLAAKIQYPKEVREFFGEEVLVENYNDRRTMENMTEIDLVRDKHYVKLSQDASDGFEVDLAKLPAGVTKLRFTCSY